MRPNELRIGNILLDREGRVCRVEMLSSEIQNCNIRAIQGAITSMPVSGIPLTIELLQSFGFELSGSNGDARKFGWVTVVPLENRFVVWLHTGFLGKDLIEIKFDYVHELQNLYFMMSGKELEVSL